MHNQITKNNYKSLEDINREILQANDETHKAGLLVELGLIEASRKNYSNALKNLEEAQKLYLQTKNFIKIADVLAEQAIVHYTRNNDKVIRAHTLLNDARYMLDSIQTPESVKVEAKILHYHGIISYSERHYSEALKYYKKALNLLDNNTLEYAKVLDDLGLFYVQPTIQLQVDI